MDRKSRTHHKFCGHRLKEKRADVSDMWTRWLENLIEKGRREGGREGTGLGKERKACWQDGFAGSRREELWGGQGERGGEEPHLLLRRL